MNEVYKAVADCRKDFVKIAYGFTADKNEVEECVQELILYFLQMNPDTLKSIFEKDGKLGITRYGSVAIRRSFTSPRSSYYYKYKKYYTHIDSTSNITENKNAQIENMPKIKTSANWVKLEQIDIELDKMYWYDRELFKLYYYESNTLDSLAEKTGISRNSLFNTIDKVRNELKKLLDD